MGVCVEGFVMNSQGITGGGGGVHYELITDLLGAGTGAL
jgi:hypothetical protein